MRIQFGAKPTQENIKQYSLSAQWDGQKFINLENTLMEFGIKDVPKMLYKQFCDKEGREPKVKLVLKAFDKPAFLSPAPKLKFVWFGHSVVLMQLDRKTILIDPMLGGNAAPISPFPIKRFSENTISLIADLPEIDLLCISHDHYDHLDFESISLLKQKVKKYYVALGVKRHLLKWGIDESLITEFDWWQNQDFENTKITFTPTRHFSGRGLNDRAKSLWGGWVFQTEEEQIWFSGDSGYGQHFKSIGQYFGGFDFAFMECGQYNKLWHQIHMYPEESVQASIDAKVKKIMPVHWAGFALAQHTWTEPVERFLAAAAEQKVPTIVPYLGEIIDTSSKYETNKWWK